MVPEQPRPGEGAGLGCLGGQAELSRGCEWGRQAARGAGRAAASRDAATQRRELGDNGHLLLSETSGAYFL